MGLSAFNLARAKIKAEREKAEKTEVLKAEVPSRPKTDTRKKSRK